MIVDDVWLTPQHFERHQINLVKNGGFEDPKLTVDWKYIDGGLPHWKSNKGEVGGCGIYSDKFASWYGQWIELDTDQNDKYTQEIDVSDTEFDGLLDQMKKY